MSTRERTLHLLLLGLSGWILLLCCLMDLSQEVHTLSDRVAVLSAQIQEGRR